jgi:hypothetical protein
MQPSSSHVWLRRSMQYTAHPVGLNSWDWTASVEGGRGGEVGSGVLHVSEACYTWIWFVQSGIHAAACLDRATQYYNSHHGWQAFVKRYGTA